MTVARRVDKAAKRPNMRHASIHVHVEDQNCALQTKFDPDEHLASRGTRNGMDTLFKSLNRRRVST